MKMMAGGPQLNIKMSLGERDEIGGQISLQLKAAASSLSWTIMRMLRGLESLIPV